MTGRASRRKGSRGELELAGILTAHGFPARRTPNSGGLAVRGDLTNADGLPCIPGYSIEVKRCERLAVPAWLRQAHADAGENVPLLIFRQNAGEWHVVLRLEDFLPLLSDAVAA